MPRKNAKDRARYQKEWCSRPENKLKRRSESAYVRRLKRDYVRERKEIPCADCGILYPYYVMQYDHVRGVKLCNLADVKASSMGWKRLKEEIDKCDVVCANCHAERTH